MKDCTCSDNLYGRIGYCPVHEGPRGRTFAGVSIWNTLKPWVIFITITALGFCGLIHLAGN